VLHSIPYPEWRENGSAHRVTATMLYANHPPFYRLLFDLARLTILKMLIGKNLERWPMKSCPGCYLAPMEPHVHKSGIRKTCSTQKVASSNVRVPPPLKMGGRCSVTWDTSVSRRPGTVAYSSKRKIKMV